MRAMWNPVGDIQLIDIENNYFIVRFSHAGDYTKVLTEGPWTIFGYYLTVQPWSRSFTPSEKHPSQVIVWIRLTGLAYHYYTKALFRHIAQLIGQVVKIDYNTQGGGRGKFARLAVLVDLNKPLLARIRIDGNIQRIEYEGLHHICYDCGTYGYSKEQCDDLRNQMEVTGDSNSTGHRTSHSEGQDTKEIESFGPWMVAETPRRRPAGRNAATDNTRSLVGSSRFAASEIPEEGTVVIDRSKEHLVTRGADLGSTKEHLAVGDVGNGVTRSAAYMASNLDKRAKASATSVEHVTGGLTSSHIAVKIMEPAMKGRNGQVGVRSFGFKGRAAKASVPRGVRGRRIGEPRVFDQPTLPAVGQSSAGLKGNMIEGFHPPVLISHSSDEETMYEMSDEEAMIEAEEGECLRAQ
ncbi:hypothetical protein GQ457_17G013930 [Hibiscus cannabinus]